MYNDIPLDALFAPEKYGCVQCSHCNGYGSSFKDPEGVRQCPVCHGIGLVKKVQKSSLDDLFKSVMEKENA